MSDQAVLPMLLTELRLPTMKRLWKDLAVDADDKGWSGPQYLHALCDYEVSERHRRRLARFMMESHLPRAKTVENYDFNAVCGVNKSKALSLGSGEIWVKDAMNVLIFGPSGVGKTHLAAAIGEKLVMNGFRVLFKRTTELVQKLQAAKKASSLPAALEKLEKYDCLILDDFGYVRRDEFETSVLFELICERYEHKSLLITCNQPFKDWEQIFTDKQMAVAAVDRLVHHATIIEIEAESYRRKQALSQSQTKKT